MIIHKIELMKRFYLDLSRITCLLFMALVSCDYGMHTSSRGELKKLENLLPDLEYISSMQDYYESPGEVVWARGAFSDSSSILTINKIIANYGLVSSHTSMLVSDNHARFASQHEFDMKESWIPHDYKIVNGYENGNVSLAVYRKDASNVLLIFTKFTRPHDLGTDKPSSPE